jgi:hypothetical protein
MLSSIGDSYHEMTQIRRISLLIAKPSNVDLSSEMPKPKSMRWCRTESHPCTPLPVIEENPTLDNSSNLFTTLSLLIQYYLRFPPHGVQSPNSDLWTPPLASSLVVLVTSTTPRAGRARVRLAKQDGSDNRLLHVPGIYRQSRRQLDQKKTGSGWDRMI